MPNGHIQLHQTRPSIIVIAMMTRPQTRLRYSVCVVSAVRDGHQGRGLQEERDRPPLQVAQVGDQQEEQEEPEEEDLVGPSDLDHIIRLRGREAVACVSLRGQSSALARRRARGRTNPGSKSVW